ncbi:MAG TPA: 50S ribosomal protein L4 [Candidatus Paceibacterota bacterium]
MEAKIYNVAGKETGKIELPDSIFGLKWNNSLMHQVVTSMQANSRQIVAHAKGRGEVRGGGRKPWRQKGTGRARHGSIRSPIWKGGGVTHGPINEKNYSRTIPKKMRAKALFTALSRKLSDGEILFVDKFSFDAPKTSEAKKLILSLSKISGFDRLASKKKNAALVAALEMTEAAKKSFRNMGNIEYQRISNLNPVAVLRNSYLVIENPKESVKTLESRASKNSKLKTQN